MAANPHRLYMSVEEYLELDRSSLDARYEYIDGVVTMLAGGSTNHSRVSINVVSLLSSVRARRYGGAKKHQRQHPP
jgi:Uma2 family endonuclease